MLKIRLARGGRVHRPVYTIVATNSRSARDGRFLEKLGQYDPNATPVLKDVKVAEMEIWIKKGAHLSSTVKSLLKRNDIKLNLG